MTDDSDDKGGISDEALRGLKEAIVDGIKEGLAHQGEGNAMPITPEGTALPVTSPPGDKGVKMKEMNPFLRFLFKGKTYVVRTANVLDIEEIGEHQIRLRLPAITTAQPAGLQHQIPQSVVLYMSAQEFTDSITGDFVIDLTEYSVPGCARASAEERALGLPGSRARECRMAQSMSADQLILNISAWQCSRSRRPRP